MAGRKTLPKPFNIHDHYRKLWNNMYYFLGRYFSHCTDCKNFTPMNIEIKQHKTSSRYCEPCAKKHPQDTVYNCTNCGECAKSEYALRFHPPDDNNFGWECKYCSAQCAQRGEKQRRKQVRTAIARGNHKVACMLCGCRSAKIRYCSRCKLNTYCSGKCQKADWQRHKLKCDRFTPDF